MQSSHAHQTSPPHPWLVKLHEPIVLGTICGLLSAIGYTVANILLREVADCDPVWVSCLKALPTVILFAPVLAVQAWRGQQVLPPVRALLALVAAAMFGQLGGNVLFQWSLGVVGIALAVPLTLGSMIVTGALLGRIFLIEPIRRRMLVAIGVLIAAIFVLSQGAGAALETVTAETGAGAGWSALWLITAGVSAACVSGLAYSVLGVVIRRGVTGKVSVAATLVTVCTVGTIGLGIMSLVRLGPSELLQTLPSDLGLMLAAGVFNALAFVCLIKALQLATVLYVNALNATQATMAAIAGVVFFGEAMSGALLIGVALTIVGLLLMRSPKRREARPQPSDQIDDQRPTVRFPPLDTAQPGVSYPEAHSC